MSPKGKPAKRPVKASGPWPTPPRVDIPIDFREARANLETAVRHVVELQRLRKRRGGKRLG